MIEFAYEYTGQGKGTLSIKEKFDDRGADIHQIRVAEANFRTITVPEKIRQMVMPEANVNLYSLYMVATGDVDPIFAEKFIHSLVPEQELSSCMKLVDLLTACKIASRRL